MTLGSTFVPEWAGTLCLLGAVGMKHSEAVFTMQTDPAARPPLLPLLVACLKRPHAEGAWQRAGALQCLTGLAMRATDGSRLQAQLCVRYGLAALAADACAGCAFRFLQCCVTSCGQPCRL